MVDDGKSSGQQIARANIGLGYECMLDSMANLSFQELHIRAPVRLRGFGLRSLLQSSAAAFIGAVERSVSAFSGEAGVCRKLEHLLGGGAEGASWWRHLMESGTWTGREFRESWDYLKQEAEQ